ncbi:GNAT family N-acetyltransferase [Virgibacillus sp. YIM 98842]|uniref:GNAT family N-acetyltransferase n=1 Tax=Virgibacillus sp. YIM 98842 TaxID=2663533 RepID=UPI0013DCC16C|nr:GNAT family N-acetyltransferase [Virgibacillus sp. YIM 98842]
MHIRKYKQSDEEALFQLLSAEGEEWEEFTREEGIQKFKRTLESSVVYVAFENDVLCGFSRSIIDGEFYIYVCDLLVDKNSRGKGIGRQLMECVCEAYPDYTVLVLSDVDEYYQKLGYAKEGSLFLVKP